MHSARARFVLSIFVMLAIGMFSDTVLAGSGTAKLQESLERQQELLATLGEVSCQRYGPTEGRPDLDCKETYLRARLQLEHVLYYLHLSEFESEQERARESDEARYVAEHLHRDLINNLYPPEYN